MRRYEILTPKDTPEKSFIIENLKQVESAAVEEKEYKNYRGISIEADELSFEKIINIISENITAFYKFRILCEYLKDIKCSIYEKYALIGTLLGADLENDKREVARALKNLTQIALESLFEFRLTKLKNNWQSLGELSQSLTRELNESQDVYELISYFVSSNGECPRITITDTTPLKLVINGTIYNPIPLTENLDINLLLTAMREHPSHIVIKNQDLLSEDLLKTFRSLGQ